MSSREIDRKKKSQLKPVKKSLPTGKRKRSNDQPNPKPKRAKVKRTRYVRAPSDQCDTHLTDLVFDVNAHGDFNEFLKPLLQDDRELDLYKWMLSFNLLKKPQKCMHSGCESTNLELTSLSQSKDHFVWKCRSCSHNNSLRGGTFFANSKCSIQLALSVVQAWCYHKSPDALEDIDMKATDIRRIYQVCIDTVNLYMKNPEENSQILGGRNSVVLLDMWPNGSLPAPACERDTKRRWGERLRVLWLSDTNHVPVRYWAKVLPPLKTSSELRMQACNKMDAGKKDRTIVQHSKKNILESENDPYIQNNQNQRYNRRKNTETHLRGCSENKPPQGRALRKVKDKKKAKPTLHQGYERKRNRKPPMDSKEQKKREERERLNDMVKAVVEIAHSHIAPSSLVLASERALPGLCDVLISSGRYEGVMSVEQLLAVKSGGQRPTSSILESIWERGTAVCKELRDATRVTAHVKLVEFLWRQRFDTGGSKTFYYILSHIASHYHLQSSANSKFPTELEF